MKLISHRGNISGKDEAKENSPTQIDLVIGMGYEVEIDVWFIDGKWSLGHDKPQYPIEYKWLTDRRNKLWIHCKNVLAVVELAKCKDILHYFWHENDTLTLTNRNFIWAYPGKQPIKDSIAVMPEIHDEDLTSCKGVCSDFVDSKYFDKMKSDFTILVQGFVEQETYDFYLKNYYSHDIIFSTWIYCDFKHDSAPPNFKFVKARSPMVSGTQNFNLQVESTSNGLRDVKTKYVIKVRGDEWYSNLDSVIPLVVKDPDRIYTCPVFFRPNIYWPYAPSDHVIVGTTENLRTMFYSAKGFLTRYQHDLIAGKPKVAETMLSVAYLMEKLGTTDISHFTKERAVEYITKYFGVFKLDDLKDYKICHKTVRTTWRNNFNPKEETSIDDIKQL